MTQSLTSVFFTIKPSVNMLDALAQCATISYTTTHLAISGMMRPLKMSQIFTIFESSQSFSGWSGTWDWDLGLGSWLRSCLSR
jgi:hypothetical protein